MLTHVDKKTGNSIVLVPELCQMTGLSDSMRSNFHLMKAIGNVAHVDAERRVQECRTLLESFDKNEACKETMKDWSVKIGKQPL